MVSNVQTLVQAAAAHCAAMRVYNELTAKSTAQLQEPAKEAYSQFEAASHVLQEMHAVLAHALYKRIVELLWAVSWHVANTVAAKREAQDEEEEEKEDDEEEDEEEGEEDEDEDEEDEEAIFGKDYPGSSDDAIEDMRGIWADLSQSLTVCCSGSDSRIPETTWLIADCINQQVVTFQNLLTPPGKRMLMATGLAENLSASGHNRSLKHQASVVA